MDGIGHDRRGAVSLGSGIEAATGDEVALLDRDGVIVAVNEAWNRFCLDNGGDPARAGRGVSYLDICDAADDEASVRLGAAIRVALWGELPAPRRLSVPCASPSQERLFDVLVSSRFDDGGGVLGATVTFSRAAAPAGPGPPSPVQAPGLDPPPHLATVAALAEASPDGLLMVESSGAIAFVNDRLVMMSGYPAGELMGQPVTLLVPEAVRARHVSLRSGYQARPRLRMMGEGRPLDLRRRDGSLLPVEISLRPTTIAGQQLVVAAVRDVTDRRVLAERARLVADALDANGDGIAVIDPVTRRRLYVNRMVLEWSGRTAEELAGVPIGAPSTPQEQEAIDRAIQDVVAGRAEQVRLETCIQKKDGRSFPAEMLFSYRAASGGLRGAGRVTVVARDITERRAAQQRLRLSEESFRAAFADAPIGMAVTVLDREGGRRIARGNTALAEIFGVPLEDLIGRDFAEFTYPVDEAADQAAARALFAGEISGYGRRKRYRRPDGRSVWVEFRSSPIDFPDLPGHTMLAHLVDVSDRAQAESLRERRARLAALASQMVTGILAGDPPGTTYQLVVDEVAQLLDAPDVALGVPGPGSGFAMVCATGPAAEALLGDPEGQGAQHGTGPRCVTSIGLGLAADGVLVLARRPGEPEFTPDERDLLRELARELAVALELGRTRVGQERLALLEERHRVARDLHDNVIQDVIAVGMQLDADALQSPDAARQELDEALVDQLEEIVRRLRLAVFPLAETSGGDCLSQLVEFVVRDAARVLGHRPVVTFSGPVDDLPPRLGAEVGAVLRESLSNVARHAHAQFSWVRLDVDPDAVRLTVEDDGVGISPDDVRGNGLASISTRAALLGGRAVVEARCPSGTRLRWSVPRAGGRP